MGCSNNICKTLMPPIVLDELKPKNNWHIRYKAMKKGLGLTNTDIAKITGNTPESTATTTQPKGSFPRWAKLAVVVYEKLSEYEIKNI